MSMLNNVLLQKPRTWDADSYDGRRYKEVQVFGSEHYNVVNNFSSDMEVTHVYRIQNPYLYGRFLLRVEQLQLRGSVYQETMYHPICEDNKNIVMEYNCDYRRYTQANSAQHYNKRPRFYKDPKQAYQRFRSMNSSQMAIVVVKVASTSPAIASECCKDWDTEYYPEYVVLLNCRT